MITSKLTYLPPFNNLFKFLYNLKIICIPFIFPILLVIFFVESLSLLQRYAISATFSNSIVASNYGTYIRGVYICLQLRFRLKKIFFFFFAILSFKGPICIEFDFAAKELGHIYYGSFYRGMYLSCF